MAGTIAREFEIRCNQGTLFRSTSYGKMAQDGRLLAESRSAIPKLVRMIRVVEKVITEEDCDPDFIAFEWRRILNE